MKWACSIADVGMVDVKKTLLRYAHAAWVALACLLQVGDDPRLFARHPHALLVYAVHILQ